jgi:predicted MFS family arabinose efflux permease
VVPRRPEEAAGSSHEGLAAQWAGVRQVFSSPLFWRIVPLTTATHSAFLAFQGLWAGPWLADVAGLERRAVAEHLLLIPVAMVAGFFLTGLAAERLARRGVRTITVAVAGFVAFFLAQAALLVLPGWQPGLVWCAFGFFGTTTALSYTLISRGFPSYLAGRANTGVNLIAFSGAFAAQWGVGVIIGRWPGEMPGSYDPAGYAAAIATVLGIEVACFAWLMWPRRDPRCRLS